MHLRTYGLARGRRGSSFVKRPPRTNVPLPIQKNISCALGLDESRDASGIVATRKEIYMVAVWKFAALAMSLVAPSGIPTTALAQTAGYTGSGKSPP
jgi:hypothetical protein